MAAVVQPQLCLKGQMYELEEKEGRVRQEVASAAKGELPRGVVSLFAPTAQVSGCCESSCTSASPRRSHSKL